LIKPNKQAWQIYSKSSNKEITFRQVRSNNNLGIAPLQFKPRRGSGERSNGAVINHRPNILISLCRQTDYYQLLASVSHVAYHLRLAGANASFSLSAAAPVMHAGHESQNSPCLLIHLQQ
jgi:hypothetical protein